LAPDNGAIRYNLANTYCELRNLELAEKQFRQAVHRLPGSPDVHNNFASLLQLLGKFPEAMHHFDTAVSLRPEFAQAHFNRALLRLLLGDFAGGWQELEWRWRVPGLDALTFRHARWHGQTSPESIVLHCAEQGLGDTLQFVRYAPLVKTRCASVALQCEKSLHRLLNKSPGIDRLVSSELSAEEFDYQVSLFSLPRTLETQLATIPANVTYLFAEPDRVIQWRQKLATERKLKVGVA
jgi:hypothetical protein